MRKWLTLVLAAMLLCTAACAEPVWQGPVLVGRLPKQAEVIHSGYEMDYGYVEELLYDGCMRIVLGCLGLPKQRDAYLTAQGYAMPEDADFWMEELLIAGQPALHQRYDVPNALGGTDTVECYTFETDEGCWLFLTSMETTKYDKDYQELLPDWVDSLELFQP